MADHRLRGRAGAAAVRAPPEELAAARRRRNAALVRLRRLGGRDPARAARPRRLRGPRPGHVPASATWPRSTRRCCPPATRRSATCCRSSSSRRRSTSSSTSSTTAPIGCRSRLRVSPDSWTRPHEPRVEVRARRRRPARAPSAARRARRPSGQERLGHRPGAAPGGGEGLDQARQGQVGRAQAGPSGRHLRGLGPGPDAADALPRQGRLRRRRKVHDRRPVRL